MPVSKDETPESGPVSASLERIKQEFDPSFCYVVFECEAGAVREFWLQELAQCLRRLGMGTYEARTYRFLAEARVLLVVKFEPADRFRVMEEIFNAGLPPEIALYAYGSSTGNPVSG